MKRMVFVAALLFPVAAFAQQPPLDPEVGTYRELLTEANGRIAAIAKQLQAANAKIQSLEAAAKAKDAPVPAPQ